MRDGVCVWYDGARRRKDSDSPSKKAIYVRITLSEQVRQGTLLHI